MPRGKLKMIFCTINNKPDADAPVISVFGIRFDDAVAFYFDRKDAGIN